MAICAIPGRPGDDHSDEITPRPVPASACARYAAAYLRVANGYVARAPVALVATLETPRATIRIYAPEVAR